MTWIEIENESTYCCGEYDIAYKCSECGASATCAYCGTGTDEPCEHQFRVGSIPYTVNNKEKEKEKCSNMKISEMNTTLQYVCVARMNSLGAIAISTTTNRQTYGGRQYHHYSTIIGGGQSVCVLYFCCMFLNVPYRTLSEYFQKMSNLKIFSDFRFMQI